MGPGGAGEGPCPEGLGLWEVEGEVLHGGRRFAPLRGVPAVGEGEGHLLAAHWACARRSAPPLGVPGAGEVERQPRLARWAYVPGHPAGVGWLVALLGSD